MIKNDAICYITYLIPPFPANVEIMRGIMSPFLHLGTKFVYLSPKTIQPAFDLNKE